MNLSLENQPQGIHKDMALASFHLSCLRQSPLFRAYPGRFLTDWLSMIAIPEALISDLLLPIPAFLIDGMISGLCDELVPSLACDVEDGAVIVKDAVCEPVLTHVLPDIFMGVKFWRAWRQ